MIGLPPGPTDHPVVQAIQFARNPYQWLARAARQFGPVFTMRLPGDSPRVVVGEPALVRRIFAMKSEEIRATPEGITVNLGKQNLLFLDGEDHRRDRKLLMPALHGRRLDAYAHTMQSVTLAAIDRLVPGTRVDLHHMLQEITLEVILRCVFGVSDVEQLRRLSVPTVTWLEQTFVPTTFLAGMLAGWQRVRDTLDDATTRVLESRDRKWLRRLPWNRIGQAKAELVAHLRDDLRRCRSEGIGDRTDILAMLAEARYDDGSPMTIEHATDELVTMLVGGHETTSNTLAWALSHLLLRPDVMARLAAERAEIFGDGPVDPARTGALRYQQACLDESMRMTPIAPAVPRTTQFELELGQWTLPAGTILFPCVYVSHHRSDLWSAPHVFRPERFLDGDPPGDRYFPFGGGRRTCIGMAFARLEMRVVLATLLDATELSPVTFEPAMPEIRGLTVAPKAMEAIVTPHRPRHRA